MKTRVAIIGAGLAGLNCAKYLENDDNILIDLFEKTNSIGGRIKTEEVDGFLLDHGFQVFLARYPEAQKSFDFKKLTLNPFLPGANIDHRYIGDPLRNISDLIPSLFSDIGTIKDKLLILKLRFESPDSSKDLTTMEFLRDYGFSEKIINKFFIPFFSGVFLNTKLENNSTFFQFLFKLFSNDYATLPENGMRDLPLNLANQLKKTTIHLTSETGIKDANQIEVNGRTLSYDYIVEAYPEKHTNFYSVYTDYFWTEKHSLTKPALYLFTKKTSKIINHVAPVSLANSNYAPKDKVLFSVNFFEEVDHEIIQTEMETLFPSKTFNFIKRFHIKEALPIIGRASNRPSKSTNIKAGDYLTTPSINGALESGRIAAEKIKHRINKQ
tara:strand:- start:2705 stop:3853 length:1149 start_codon:yes stop_codon:yes gene_type:complete